MNPNSRTIAMMLIVLINAGFQILSSDRIPVGYGFGYDGQDYAALARDFPNAVSRSGMGNERTQRVLPSAVIYAVTSIGLLPRSDTAIVVYFQILNLCLLLWSVGLWNGLGRVSKLPESHIWLGFLILFFCYPNAKSCFYYATLTDTTSFFLGLLVFYLIVRQLWTLVFIALIVGYWGSSTLLLWMAPLIIFSNKSLTESLSPRPALFVTSAIAIAYALLAVISVYHWKYLPPITFAPLWIGWVPISLVLGSCYVILATYPLLMYRFQEMLPPGGLNRVRWMNLVTVALIFIVCGFLGSVLTGGAEGQGLIRKTLIKGNSIPVRSIAKPLIFLVAHVAYFGPIVVLAALNWQRVCKTFGFGGFGYLAFCLMTLAFGMSSESRHLLVGMAPFVVMVLIAIREENLNSAFLAGFVVLTLFASRVWLMIGTNWDINDHATSYPAQYYFMGSGPWLSDEMYWVQAGYMVVCAAIIWCTTRDWRNAKRAESNCEQGGYPD